VELGIGASPHLIVIVVNDAGHVDVIKEEMCRSSSLIPFFVSFPFD
jgi:hypothetical protein